METDNKTKSNLLILILCLILLGLISIFYVGAPTKKPAPVFTPEWTRPLTDAEVSEFGTRADPKNEQRPLTDEEVSQFGKNANPKNDLKPLTDEEVKNFGKNSR